MWLLLRSSLRRAKKKKSTNTLYPVDYFRYSQDSISTFEGEHSHVHAGQFAVGDLQLLQGVGEAGGQGVVLFGQDGELLLGLLYLSGANWRQFGERNAAGVAASLCQASH